MRSKRNPFDPTQTTFHITATIVGHIDLFTRPEYFQEIYDSWNYCIAHKGLLIHAYVIMTNHYHLLASTQTLPMSDIIKSTKQYTSNRLYFMVRDSDHESRKKWLLNTFEYCGKKCPNNEMRQIWQQHSHPQPLIDPNDMGRVMHYIHMNPVKAGLVHKAEYYQHSSAEYYSGGINPHLSISTLTGL